jgi:hypothetical protein
MSLSGFGAETRSSPREPRTLDRRKQSAGVGDRRWPDRPDDRSPVRPQDSGKPTDVVETRAPGSVHSTHARPCAVIGEESAPRLRRRAAAMSEVLRYGRLASSIPSFCNSPWMRGVPQRGFASRIWRINARRSRTNAGVRRAAARLPAPIGGGTRRCQRSARGGSHGLPPVWPDAREQQPPSSRSTERRRGGFGAVR